MYVDISAIRMPRGSGCLRPVQKAGEAALAPIGVSAVQRLALRAVKGDHGAVHSVPRILLSILDGLTRAPDECSDCSIPVAIDFTLPEGAPVRFRRRDSLCHVVYRSLPVIPCVVCRLETCGLRRWRAPPHRFVARQSCRCGGCFPMSDRR